MASTLGPAGSPQPPPSCIASLGKGEATLWAATLLRPKSQLQSCPVYPPSPLHDLEDSATLAASRYFPRLCPPCPPRKVRPGAAPQLLNEKAEELRGRAFPRSE